MPQAGWNDKRERQYEHIKGGLRERGEPEDTAEEIAAKEHQGPVEDEQGGTGTSGRALDAAHLESQQALSK